MRKKININEELVELGEIISVISPLYITGGYVRNSLMGICCDDIDIASAVPPDKVVELLSNSKFKLDTINKRLGTIQIRNKNSSYEYTTFRKDNYPVSKGTHRPYSVELITDINEDARRRDFTINAIYYDIIKDEYVDCLGGIEDINNKVIRTTVEPSKVFSEDGLRILRLVRFAAELDFDIEQCTFNAAQDNVQLLYDIAPERIQMELNKILNADKKYDLSTSGHYKGISLLIQLGALDIILDGLTITNITSLKNAKDNRLAVLLLSNNNTKENIYKALDKVRYSNSIIKEILRLKDLVDNNSDKEEVIIEQIIDNNDIIEKYIDILSVIGYNGTQYRDVLLKLRENKLPLSVKDLKVRGNVLVDLGIDNVSRKAILRRLVTLSIEHNAISEEEQMKLLREKILWKD